MFWIVLSIVLLYLFYKWSTAKHGKWESKGVRCIKPFLFLGSYPKGFLSPKPLVEGMKGVYEDMEGVDMGVYYMLRDPILVLRDTELIREVCVKSFDHFVNRTVMEEMMEVHSEFDKMLTNMTGERWKAMRAGLSPAFTTGKLKSLVGTMNRCGPQFNDYIVRQGEKDPSGLVEMRSVFERYTLGVIAQAVFGIEAKVFEDENSDFIKHSKELQNKFAIGNLLRFLVYLFAPRLAKAMRLRIAPKEPFDFFAGITNTLMQKRRDENSRSNDMLQLFIDLHNAKDEPEATATESQFEAEAELHVKIDARSLMTEDAIAQSATLFLIAGFDTTASTLSLIAYHLATNPEVQARAHEEVDEVAADLADDELSYNGIGRLEYMEMVMNETFRLTPIAVILERECTKDYTMSNGVKIEKGSRVHISTPGLHMDPEYWEEPDKFNPERFSKENKSKIRPYTFLPFGVGPRNCIGMRFAIMKVKVVLFHLLRRFSLEPSDKTPVPAKFDLLAAMTSIKGGNWLRLVPRGGDDN